MSTPRTRTVGALLAVSLAPSLGWLLAGCSGDGGPAAAADEPRTVVSGASESPSPVTVTSEALVTTPLDGVWVTRPITRQRIAKVLDRAGLTKYLGNVMPEVVSLPARFSMTIANGRLFMQMIPDREAPVSYDHESVLVKGDRMTIAPVKAGAPGHSIYEWARAGSTLTLRLIGTTEPPVEGVVPAEAWQRLLYTSGNFYLE